ncbi:PIN domain-containing protein [Streptomyces sp. NPDC002120]|uniref:PIN domain-containing protein n=1 Tax=Streptomyces sp. NPDC002120 TaxID=3364631 RepID=UPI003688055D
MEDTMIVFDTNAVNMLPPEGARADFIRKLRQSGHHRVAVPWMVLEELAAHQAKLYPVKYEAVLNTLTRLRAIVPWELKSTLEPLDLERLMNHWRDVYGEIFEVIETSPEVARRALAREALALKPAKRAKDHSEGARDVAIWFSILEFLKANPDETVCFVTNNTDDFGDGITYPYPMNEDVEGLENRLTRITDFNEVVSAFTRTVSGAAAEVAADELLRSRAVRARVAQTAVELLTSPSGFTGLDTDDTVVQWRGWWTAPEVELLTVTDVTGHEIEGDVWYTANARWLLYGLSFDEDAADPRYTACTWETKVLFSARDGAEAPTVLAPQDPQAPDVSDSACVALLKRIKERTADISRRTMKDVLGATSMAEVVVSKEFLAALDVAGTLPRTYSAFLPKIDYSALFPSHNIAAINSVVQQMGPLVDFSGLNRSVAEMALQQHLDLGESLRRSLDGLVPKLDIAGLMPRTDFSALIASTLAKGTAAQDSDDEGAEAADNQLSFEDAAVAEEAVDDGTDPEPHEDTDS